MERFRWNFISFMEDENSSFARDLAVPWGLNWFRSANCGNVQTTWILCLYNSVGFSFGDRIFIP